MRVADGPRAPRTAVRPAPLRQFVLKTHSRCNLACTYCYLYAGADRGWRSRPRTPARDVVLRTAERIAEHAGAHGLSEVSVVLHGGEPLLAGAERLAADIATIRRVVPCAVHARVQTNGTLLSAPALRTLRDAGIKIGVSLDGGLPAHNRERVDHAGRPSFAATAAGLRRLAGTAPEAYSGLLCVVDPRHDPVEVYESLLGFHPPAVDFLLPHGNWTSPPPGLPAAADDPAPYGRWLTALFDRWWDDSERRTRIRLFEECVALLLGAPASGEHMGLRPFTAVVVETDGSIEQVDSLKSAYDGAAATGLDVFRHSFDDALSHPGIAARQSGRAALGATCRACPLVAVCGGGNYAHRYRAPGGFRNPSVYCADLAHLIRHVHRRLAAAAVDVAGHAAAGHAAGHRAPGGAARAAGAPGPTASGPEATDLRAPGGGVPGVKAPGGGVSGARTPGRLVSPENPR